MTDEKVKDLRVSTKLIHSHQLKDGGLKRRLASTSKTAAILLMTFVSTCEASWNMPGIQSFVQCPYWLGQPQHMFQRTSEKEEWEPFSPQARPRSKELHTCMVFPLNSNNYNLFAEDLEWQCKPLSLPKGVKIFLQKSVSTHVDVMEIYSPPRVTLEAKQQNQKGIKPKWRVGQALDLTTGYDFKNAKTRKHVMNLIKTWKPALVILSPPCTVFSPLRNLSSPKRDPEVVQLEEEEGLEHWEFALEIAEEQDDNQRGFLLEHPKEAWSWKHPRAHKLKERKTVYEFVVDLCAFKLVTRDGILAKKPTMLITNCFPLVRTLHKRCQGGHVHRSLMGGRAADAARYTRLFVQAILRGLRHHLQYHGVIFCQQVEQATSPDLPMELFHAVEQELQVWSQPLATYINEESNFQEDFHWFLQGKAELSTFPSSRILGGGSARVPTLRRKPMPTLEHEADEGDPVMENVQNKLRPLAESDEIQQAAEDAIEKVRKDGKLTTPANLRREVFRLHRNLGHPDLWTFLRALRHAQAKTEVIAWVRSEFKCPICEARQRPSLPRPGHLVRNLEFNNVVGVDVIFFDWKNQKFPMLNVCAGELDSKLWRGWRKSMRNPHIKHCFAAGLHLLEFLWF